MILDFAQQIRAELLSNSPGACVARELWSCSSGTYLAYRECILARRRLQREQQHAREAAAACGAHGEAAGPGGAAGEGSGRPGAGGRGGHSLPATVKYSFEGVKHVLAESSSAVSALAFAPLRADLLAFGCVDGQVWLVALPAAPTAQTPPACTKARKMHAQAVQALDWAYDSSQLLSVGHDGSLCVWDATDPAGLSCIRSVAVPTTAFLCGRFHRVNFSLALVGTSSGHLQVFNCSTGMSDSRYKVATPGGGTVQVTALDSSNHHVFLGDSSGHLHLYACEMHGRQLSRLRPVGRLRLAPPAAGGSGGGGGGGVSGSSSSGLPQLPPACVTSLQYVAFCGATDSPVLLAALADGSVCVVRANETRHTAELHLRRALAAPSPAALAPYAASTPTSSAASTPTSFARLSATGGLPHPPHQPASPSPSPSPSAAASASAAAALTTLLRVSPCICPLSAIHDVPLITAGSDDTSVAILDVTAKSFGAPGGARGAGGGGGGGGGGAVDRPLTVTVLKAHRAPVVCMAWSYDESLLASADADGMVVVWQRCRLF